MKEERGRVGQQNCSRIYKAWDSTQLIGRHSTAVMFNDTNCLIDAWPTNYLLIMSIIRQTGRLLSSKQAGCCPLSVKTGWQLPHI